MKKNNLLPILLVAGAGVAAFLYFKKRGAAKEIAEGVDIEPVETKKETTEDQTTTTGEEPEERGNTAETYIKKGTEIFKAAKQIIKGRKKRRSSVSIGPTEESRTAYPETETTRKNRRLEKRTARKTKRTTSRATIKARREQASAARKAKRTTRRSKSAVRGFDDLSILY